MTVTTKLHEVLLPEASVAVQLTVLFPTMKVVPEAGEQTEATPAQLSDTVGVKVTFAEHCPEAAGTVIGAGHVIVGGWVSITTTWKLQLPTCPDVSVAVQLTRVVPTGKLEPDGGSQGGLASGFT